MQVTTLSFFRFEGFWDQFWAFRQMGLARRPLRRLPGIGFWKLMGVGRALFNPAPNFSLYAILATWPSVEAARAQTLGSAVFERYRARSVESWTLVLSATRSRGAWDHADPFPISEPLRPDEPVGVLTRATIDVAEDSCPFWRSVPAGERHGRPPSRRRCGSSIGMGEWPISRAHDLLGVGRTLESLQTLRLRGGRPP
jgi:spheroidene monooxygenase